MPHPDSLQPRILRPSSPRHLEDLLRHVHETRVEHHLLELARDEHIVAHLCGGLFEQLDPVQNLAVGRVLVVVGFGVKVEFGEFNVAAGFERSGFGLEGGWVRGGSCVGLRKRMLETEWRWSGRRGG